MKRFYIKIPDILRDKEKLIDRLYMLGYKYFDDDIHTGKEGALAWKGDYFLITDNKSIHPRNHTDYFFPTYTFDQFMDNPKNDIKPGNVVRILQDYFGYIKGDIGFVMELLDNGYYRVKVHGRESTSDLKDSVAFRINQIELLPSDTVIPPQIKKENDAENPYKVGDYVYLPINTSSSHSLNIDNIPVMTPLLINHVNGLLIGFNGYNHMHRSNLFSPLSDMPNSFSEGNWVVFIPEIAQKYGLYTSMWNKPHVLYVSKIRDKDLVFENNYTLYGIANNTVISNAHYCFRKATGDDLRRLYAARLHKVFPLYKCKNLSVGDTVKITHSGKIYPTYRFAFGFLGFSNLSYNDCEKGTIGKIDYITTHHQNSNDVIVKVSTEDGGEILIGIEGLEKVNLTQNDAVRMAPKSISKNTEKISLILRDDDKIELGSITSIKSINISLI